MCFDSFHKLHFYVFRVSGERLPPPGPFSCSVDARATASRLEVREPKVKVEVISRELMNTLSCPSQAVKVKIARALHHKS